MYADFRDCDYEDGEGPMGYGTGYTNADMWIYYDKDNGKFYDGDMNELAQGSPLCISGMKAGRTV